MPTEKKLGHRDMEGKEIKSMRKERARGSRLHLGETLEMSELAKREIKEKRTDMHFSFHFCKEADVCGEKRLNGRANI